MPRLGLAACDVETIGDAEVFAGVATLGNAGVVEGEDTGLTGVAIGARAGTDPAA